MKKNNKDNNINSSRRDFIKKTGTAVAGLFMVPYLKPSGVFAYNFSENDSFSAIVAITNTIDTPADSYIYDDVNGGVKQKVEYLIEQLGGISDIFSSGKKVVIKINLTGGSGNAVNDKLNGYTVYEAMWSHYAVVRAVVESIIATGVSANDITIVESLGSYDSFDNSVFEEYKKIQSDLRCKLVDISKGTFVDISTGTNFFNYDKLTMNQIVRDTDVYVSIGKLKHHAEAGFTGSIKNQVGSVPQSSYTTSKISYRRQALHSPTNNSSAKFLPRSVCDLFAARPVHFSIIDGIKNATGGEGVWNANFSPSESHVLLAGKDPVATDSIGAFLMGLDCESEKLKLPGDNGYGDTEADSYLSLLHTKGAGTNQLSEIEVVGDGKDLITGVKPITNSQMPTKFKLCANYPNPFNPSTMIVFYLPNKENVKLNIFDSIGRETETLVEGEVPAGEHRLQWNAQGLSSGIYFCRLQVKQHSETIKMIYQK